MGDSRQARWMEKRRLQGKCVTCGVKRDCGSLWHCHACLVKKRERMRVLRGYGVYQEVSVWGRRSRGRPPYGKGSVSG